MRIFISGGCKNGKSYYAQRLAKAQQKGPLYYIATMRPVDSEDDRRIERHRKDREGWGFVTIEQPARIEEILDKCDHGGSFLLDSLTALLAGEMFPPDAADSHATDNHAADSHAAERIIGGLMQVLGRINDIVIVSDYIYSDACIFDPLTESFRKSLAEIDRAAAKRCDVVLEAAHTSVIIHKGEGMFGKLNEKSDH